MESVVSESPRGSTGAIADGKVTLIPEIPASNVCRPTWSLKKDLTEMFVQALIALAVAGLIVG
jgi:hypothetical protein